MSMIKIEHLRKEYPNVTPLKDVCAEINKGDVISVIGPSGTGKSTLLRCLNQLEEPTSGTVSIDGEVITDPKCNISLVRRKMGMVFQSFNLFANLNIVENVMSAPVNLLKVPKEQARKEAMELLKRVGLAEKAENYPDELSGGQKQRVAIARALATQPDILYCDEATSALDPNTTQSILALIREIQKKMNLTVVMITHQMEVVRDACEYVAVVEDGKVVEQGKVKDIFANPKTKTTRDFIKNVLNDKEMVKWSDQTGKFHLHFTGKTPEKPLLSTIAKKFNVEFNIFAAGISHLPDEDVGYMNADIMGSDEEVSKVIAWLEENSVHVRKEQE